MARRYWDEGWDPMDDEAAMREVRRPTRAELEADAREDARQRERRAPAAVRDSLLAEDRWTRRRSR